jgi:hypothetical protein
MCEMVALFGRDQRGRHNILAAAFFIGQLLIVMPMITCVLLRMSMRV